MHESRVRYGPARITHEGGCLAVSPWGRPLAEVRTTRAETEPKPPAPVEPRRVGRPKRGRAVAVDGVVYPCASEAAAAVGGTKSGVASALRAGRDTYLGHTVSYVEES